MNNDDRDKLIMRILTEIEKEKAIKEYRVKLFLIAKDVVIATCAFVGLILGIINHVGA